MTVKKKLIFILFSFLFIFSANAEPKVSCKDISTIPKINDVKNCLCFFVIVAQLNLLRGGGEMKIDPSNAVRMSKYFLPVLRETPQEAQTLSHRYMLRAGMIRQASAGIYSWLPLGFRVLKKIEQIVREEQNLAGAQELLMPTIQSSDIWKKSGRYEDYGKEMLLSLIHI